MIASRLASIRNEITHLSSRHIELVAVSKTKPVADVMEAYSAGQRSFGENYVGELVEKGNQLPSDIRWHFIGHLQSNKVSKLLTSCPNLYMIESVDSIKLATKLNQTLTSLDPPEPLRVLVEIRTSSEDTKSGISIDGAELLIEHIISHCPFLRFSGVMTIADPSTPEESFKSLFAFSEKLRAQSVPVEVVSMGMSGDYPLAISLGSTEVRIGSSIFGHR
jgi:PLP dependent protein